MSENTTQEKGLFETLELRSSDSFSENSKAQNLEHVNESEHEDYSIKFLIQDMFLEHFFP